MSHIRHASAVLVTLAINLLSGCEQGEPAVTPARNAAATSTRPTFTPTPPVPPSPATPRPAPATQATVVIKSSPASIDAILAGSKTSTTRKGKRSYAVGPAVTTDGRRRVDVDITAVVPKRVANLTAADAASDGSASLSAYRAALVHSYPGLTDDDIVSVVHLRAIDHR